MKLYKEALRSFFSGYVGALRRRRGLTQEEMAERLRITGRAYSDLERGIYCFSTVALVFLLLMLEEHELKELLSPPAGGACKSRGQRGGVVLRGHRGNIWAFARARSAC